MTLICTDFDMKRFKFESRGEQTFKRSTLCVFYLLLMLQGFFGATLRAEQANVAVAANFTEAAREIGRAFEAQSGHTLILSFGSTGQIYTQISQAAPFDVFLAADQARPGRAIDEGFALAQSRFTYAVGQLALYSANPDLRIDSTVLRSDNFTRLAIANPETAPYGQAAIEYLRNIGLHDVLKKKLVLGANISQTMQFVATGNAELGIVASAQIATHKLGSHWIVPQDLHNMIAQDAVLLTPARKNSAAIEFMEFLAGDMANDIKLRFGYLVAP